jgi:hypothetical protein
MNVMRATMVGEILRKMGYAAVVVHGRIHQGEWGDDNDPEARAAGMKATMDILDDVINSGGYVAVLLRDDCTMSIGTANEVRHAVGRECEVAAMTWNGWNLFHKFATI